MSDDFDWSHVAENVVQHEVGKVAIYGNLHGDVVVRQEQQWDEERDTFIVIARGNAFAAARAILIAIGFGAREADMMARRPDIDWEGVVTDFARSSAMEEEEPKALTGAERSRKYRERKKLERDARDESVTERDAVTEPQLQLVAGE